MEQELQLATIPVDRLIPYERNARKHPKKQLERIAANIRENGFLVPVLIDENCNVIAGHGRIEAAKLAGMTAVPCLIESHLTQQQRRAFILADNKLAEESSWDKALMGLELQELAMEDFPLELTGFNESFLPNLDPEPESESEAPKKRGVKLETAKECRCPQCGYTFRVDA